MKWLPLKYAENRKILIFHIYFLNKHILLNIRCLKTAVHGPVTHLEGSVSQNFDIGLSSNFIACTCSSWGFKKNTKKIKKITRFLV